MMIIRKSQMDMLAAAAAESFIDRLCVFLRDKLPETVKDLDDVVLRSRVAMSRSKAREYGLSQQRAMARYVTWSFVVGPQFDRHPKIQRLLSEPGVEPNLRVDLIRGLVLPEEWRAARNLSMPGVWGVEENRVKQA